MKPPVEISRPNLSGIVQFGCWICLGLCDGAPTQIRDEDEVHRRCAACGSPALRWIPPAFQNDQPSEIFPTLC